MEKLKKTLQIAVFSRAWGDKGIGNILEHDVLERFYGDKCVHLRALKETIAKTCKHIFKNTGCGRFCGKTCR